MRGELKGKIERIENWQGRLSIRIINAYVKV